MVRHIEPANIEFKWLGPAELTIHIDNPHLEWTVWMQQPLGLRWLNMRSEVLPFWTWQKALLLKPREWMARLLGMGDIKLAGVMPSGHFGVLMPQRIDFVNRTRVQLAGVDLGQPATVSPNPTIGDVPLPARGIFAIGQAHWNILDEEEYHRTGTALLVDEPY